MTIHLSAEEEGFVHRLPKTETHLHIEGALPRHFLRALDPVKYGRNPDSWEPNFKFRDFAQFDQQLLGEALVWYSSPERYHEAAREIFRLHLAQNVRYVETSFASGVIEFLGLDGREILDAILSAVPDGLTVKVFLGIHHNGCSGKMRQVIEDSIHWEGLAGHDLHGAEDVPLEPWTAEIWEASHKAGKLTKAHAGEFCGPDFVWRVIDELGVKRIQHGIRSVEDPVLVERLIKDGIALDICPISNHKLVPGVTLENHPIRQLFDAGVICTISTDDPLVFGNCLEDEYKALIKYRGFLREELVQIAINGFKVALLPESEKINHITDCERICGAASEVYGS